MSTQSGRDRLAEQVKEARKRKFRTVAKAVAAADVSRGSWDSVERGNPAKESTLTGIELALGWPVGTAQRIIDGTATGEFADVTADEIGKLRRMVGEAEVDDALRRRMLGVIDDYERGSA